MCGCYWLVGDADNNSVDIPTKVLRFRHQCHHTPTMMLQGRAAAYQKKEVCEPDRPLVSHSYDFKILAVLWELLARACCDVFTELHGPFLVTLFRL